MRMKLLLDKLSPGQQAPQQHWRRFVGGCCIFFVGVAGLYIAAAYESQWLFYTAACLMAVGVLRALPGYLGLLIKRLID